MSYKNITLIIYTPQLLNYLTTQQPFEFEPFESIFPLSPHAKYQFVRAVWLEDSFFTAKKLQKQIIQYNFEGKSKTFPQFL